MSLNNSTERDSLFPTPNPRELKEESEKGSVLERYPDPDANHEYSEEQFEAEESYFQDDEPRALSSSPIINANLSAG